jgi:hypothetical protein
MAQWEYSKIDLNDASRRTDDIGLLNDAGKDGWELVGIASNSVAYFKRQLEEHAAAPEELPPAQSARRKRTSRAEPT